MQCCGPWWRNPLCTLDRLQHWAVFRLKREFWLPGVNWVCDRHEHNMTGISMDELARERRARKIFEEL